jgi:hypothetical protein
MNFDVPANDGKTFASWVSEIGSSLLIDAFRQHPEPYRREVL